MLVSQTIENIINGISQQPPTQRLPSQCEIKENCYETVADGCAKRPPTQHLSTLVADDDTADIFTKIIDMGAAGYFLVVVDPTPGFEDISIFDLATGTLQTVNYTAGAYLSYLVLYNGETSARENFSLINVADYTMLLNKTRNTGILGVAAGTGLTSHPPYVVQVRQGNYSTVYKIEVTLNGTVYTSSKTTADATISDIRTTQIASDLYSSFAPPLPATITAVLFESSISFAYTPAGPVYTDFKVAISDSMGSTDMTIVKDVIQNFTDLPTIVPTPFNIVKVVGGNASLASPYYVKFVPDKTTDTFGFGTWVETSGGFNTGIPDELNGELMPHKLSRDLITAVWTLAPAIWGPRVAGDGSIGSAPFPSFMTPALTAPEYTALQLGSRLSDIFLYKNRFGMIANDSVIMSRHGQFHELFPSTVTTLLDTAPIDFKVAHPQTPNLKNAVPYNGGLILFTDKLQFILSEESVLTPRTASITPVSEFINDPGVHPAPSGDSIFFSYLKGNFTGVRELVVDNINHNADANDITAHVAQYLQGTPVLVAASTSDDVLGVVTDSEPNVMYIFMYHWAGDQKVQASWGKWIYPTGSFIHGATFIASELYLVVSRGPITLADTSVVPGGVHLEKIKLSQGNLDTGSTILIHLDRKVESDGLAPVYSVGDDATTYTLPYRMIEEMNAVVRIDSGTYRVGQLVPVVSQDGYTLIIQGDTTAVPMVFGVPYVQRLRFSPQYQRGGPNNTVDVTGRLQMKRWKVLYEDTGYFRSEVTPAHRSTYTKKFTGYTYGIQPGLGIPPNLSGEMSFLVPAKNDEVTIDLINDSHFASRFLSANWEGEFVKHSR